MKNLFTTIFLSFLLLSASAFAASDISQPQMLSLINAPKTQSYVVVDVRSAEEFEAGHVPGAINIPHGNIDQAFELLADKKTAQVILYCRSGRRAGIAAEKLSELGFSNLKHLAGDMKAWEANQLPTQH